MSEIIYCSQCKNSGRTNRCYITGYDSKCGHNLSLAYTCHKSGSEIMVCSHCNNGNRCFITGYDYKCGHDNGWAYIPNQQNATCNSCGKNLNGKWSMETNSNNISYFNTTTGRYLGISDGYFLYGDSPNWVYSYCKPCWVKEIKKILPKLNPENQSNATCASCGKNLNGRWLMENNPSNNNYLDSTTGRYLGISDGYFLYGDSPNWVYSYCKPCWIKQIKAILPKLGIIYKELQDNQQNATCNSCGKTLNGKWLMESNPSNVNYLNSTTGRYLGISDGYFLYGTNSDWVYSYCKPCWIKEIEKILPNIGLSKADNQKLIEEYKNKNAELQNIINDKEKEIIRLKKEINELKKNKDESQANLNSAPINLNNYENIISQCFKELQVDKIKELLKSSEIEEISELDKSLTSNIISLKAITDFKSICQTIVKKNIKEILEKIDKNVEKIKIRLNNINSTFDRVKEELSNKDIPEKVTNESISPLKKLIQEEKGKLENLEKIKEEIYKIYLKITSD